MFKSYFKVGWRNLIRNKGYSAINIGGLASGMMVAILIGLWIADELTFDSHFKNHKRLAQVMINQTHEGVIYSGGSIAPVIAEPLRTKYGSDFKALSLASWNNDHILSFNEKRISGAGRWAQPDFPTMFTLDMTYGRRDALKDPSTIMLSSSLAKALFGNEDPLSKTIRIDNRFDMIVGGVFEDLPSNTTFADTKLLLSWTNAEHWRNKATEWDNHNCALYVQLADHAEIQQISEKIKSLPTPHIKAWKEELMLHPMDQVHLYSQFENGKPIGGLIQFVWLFGIIGGFVLLLACINFMNLSTARSEKRAKEVGIRKTVGSMRDQLVGQFLTESVVVALAALVFSLLLVQLSLPFFNTLANKDMSIQWNSATFWLLLIGFALFSGIISGSYPAFYLSAFKPIKVLKGTFKAGRMAALPRKVLVVIQFTVSITLIIGTTIVFQQIQFAKDRPVGYSRNGLITVPINTPDLQNHFETLRNDLLQTGVVKNIARASHSPAYFDNNTSIEWPGKDPANVVFFRNVNVTPEYGKTIGWTIKDGRDFSDGIASDSSAVILNATGAEITKLKNPIGEKIKYSGKEYTIIGVVEDMVTQSPYDRLEPSIFFMEGWLGVITIRIEQNVPVREALAKLETVFKKNNPNAPFEFSFVDKDYSRKFADEERIGHLATFFAALAVFISCLGLFGLASFVAEQRTKEIGIRKTMGASVASLWQLLSKDFLALVIISCFISTPLALYFMKGWLEQYNYRTSPSWQLFVAVGAGALVIALITVSIQSIKAAMANPVKSLRSE
jgi:putative ABC transport system permease protein